MRNPISFAQVYSPASRCAFMMIHIKNAIRFGFLVFLALFAWSFVGHAKDFEIFDGRFYNGLFYPRVDAIEWGDTPHMEFHVYSKDKPLEITAVPGDKNGKPVLWMVYDLKFRGERVCRHIIAPAQFKQNDKVYAYKDSSNPEYDNYYVSTHPLTDKGLVPYTMAPYAPCNDEMASNMPGTGAAPTKTSEQRMPASVAPEPAKQGKNIPVDYENRALPFSF